MKKKTTALFNLVLFLALLCFDARGQQYFTNVFDYQKINTKSFTVNIGANNEQKFINSSVTTCLALADLAKNGAWNESRVIGQVAGNIKIKAQKMSYTDFVVQWGSEAFSLRLIFVRPNDELVRPCVLLSPGSGSDFNNWYNYLGLGVADYVSKGYAVAFFENYNTKYAASHPNAATNLTLGADAEMPFYALYQFANAAAKYVAGNSASLKIDTNLLFAGGNSAGGFSAYSLALADEENFTHPVFSVLGDKNDKVMPEYLHTTYTIKGIGIIGSGLFLPDAKMGDLIDPSDSALRAVLWHGSTDPLILPNCCPNTPCNTANDLPICGALGIGERLCDAGAAAQINLICNGSHLAVVPQMTVGQINISQPNIATLLGPLKREVQQYMDIQLKITEEFKKVIDQAPTSSCSINYWNPKGFPNPLNANWYLRSSDACLQTVLPSMADRISEERGMLPLRANVSPNPSSSGIFMVRIPDDGQQVYDYVIWDMLGQQVQKAAFSASTMDQTIDLGSQPAGVYQLVIRQKGSIVFQERLLVQK